jgi:hypothetical protein
MKEGFNKNFFVKGWGGEIICPSSSAYVFQILPSNLFHQEEALATEPIEIPCITLQKLEQNTLQGVQQSWWRAPLNLFFVSVLQTRIAKWSIMTNAGLTTRQKTFRSVESKQSAKFFHYYETFISAVKVFFNIRKNATLYKVTQVIQEMLYYDRNLVFSIPSQKTCSAPFRNSNFETNLRILSCLNSIDK